MTFSLSTVISRHKIFCESIIKLTKLFLSSIPQFKLCSIGLDLVGNLLDCLMSKKQREGAVSSLLISLIGSIGKSKWLMVKLQLQSPLLFFNKTKEKNDEEAHILFDQ